MITIRLFAILRELAGNDELDLDFSKGTVSDLLDEVSSRYPVLSGLILSRAILVSVNREFVRRNALVKNGDEVALMPPFSGGNNRT